MADEAARAVPAERIVFIFILFIRIKIIHELIM
jgi:hypothetical protein